MVNIPTCRSGCPQFKSCSRNIQPLALEVAFFLIEELFYFFLLLKYKYSECPNTESPNTERPITKLCWIPNAQKFHIQMQILYN